MKKTAVLIVLSVVAAGMLFLGGSRWQTRPLARPAAAPPAGPFAAAAQPLQFVENRGQADARARYILRGSGRTVYLTDNGLLFDFLRFRDPFPPKSQEIPAARPARRLVVGLDLVGSAPHPEMAAAAPRAARFHYLIGNDRSKWVTDVPAYGEVLYRDVYPAVDMRVYDDRGTVRYDFIVRPGGRVGDIRLAVRGAEELRLDEGRLVADTEFGDLAQSEPVVFQEGPGGREPVEGSFAYAGGREYGFAVGGYDPSRPLVIDPAVMTLGYSTFLGGGGTDVAYDVKWDGSNYFVTGSTTSAGFPVTAGAYDTTLSGTDAFVAKIDATASGAASLVWCTFIGGSGSDAAYGIDLLGARAYIVGTTYSSDFPLVNAGYMTYNDGSDAFVCQLDGSGASLDHSVCVGAPAGAAYDRYDTGKDISVYMTHAIWICGSTTYGPDFYYNTDGSHREWGVMTSPNTAGDAYMLQVNFSNAASASPGVSMVFGGQNWDQADSIIEDGSRIYLTGFTESGNYPVSAGAFQSSHQGGRDAFVFKTDFGGSLTYSTFLGSGSDDMGTGIDIGAGGAYVCGYTYGSFPVTADGYDTLRTHSYGTSGFLARVNESGGSLGYSTYLETENSGQYTYAYGIATNSLSYYDCWVTGATTYYMQGTLGTATKNYYQTYRGGYDAFAARFDTSASGSDSCLFMTHLGGTASGNEEKGLAVDGYQGTAVVAGSTNSGDFPVSGSAYDSSLNGGTDAFVATLIEPALAVTTDGATEYSSSATLHSTLTSKAGAASVSMRFEYGTTSGALGSSTAWNGVSGSVPYHYSATITGLTPGTTYYYRAVVQNYYLYGTSYGAEKSFTTPALAGPTVTTTAASAVTATTASSGGNVTAMGSDPVTARGVCWSTSNNPTTADSHTSDGTGTGSFTSALTGLSGGTLYHVRAYATNAAGTAYGGDVTFTTLQAPTVTTQAVTAITTTSATGNGNITSLGVPNPTAHGVCWNTTGTPTTAGSHSDNGAASATGAFTSGMTGLTAYTTYYVRAYATNSVGTAYGSEVSFTTSAVAPTVTTQAVTAIDSTTATGNGNITALGVPNPTAHGVCWSTTSNPTTAGSHTDAGAASSTGAFTSAMTGLAAYTTYYVRAYATNAAGTAYGNEVSFTTSAIASTVTTQAVTAIGSTSATGNGNITSLGVPNPTAHGLCWNTTGTPTTAGSHSDNGAASATGGFTSGMTGLTAYTTYYVRAYATNSAGTAYGNEVSFTTSAIASTVTTQAVTAITATTATGNGNITSLGVPNPTAHGVCWNTTGTPTTAGSHSDNGAASATGGFTSGMTGLTAYTTYYVRAYATNAAGTAYGNEVSFTTSAIASTVTTQAVTAITATTATGNGNITSLGVPNPTAHGVCWNTTGTPTTAGSHSDNGAASATGGFTSGMTGLTAYTTYYVRAYATNAAGTAYGNEVSFMTIAIASTVTTQAVTAIGSTTATGNGNITSLGVPNPTAHGVCWSTASNPTTAGSHTDGGAVSATGAFSGSLSGLSSGTTYYVRAYATNVAGTSYGNEVTFITVPPAPVATAATSITTGGFTANWNAATGAASYRLDVSTASDFASYVTGYQNLNVLNVTAYAVSGLSAGVTYYYRVRAVNGGGVSASSNVITVATVSPAPVATAATSVTATGFTANWNAATGATGYYLDVSTTNDFSSFVAGYQNLNVSSVISYAVTGLAGGTTYYYRVRAYNGSGTSGYSNVITVATVPPTPAATAATSVTATGFTANWNAAAGATGYYLDVSTSYTFATYVSGFQNLNVNNVTTYAVSGLTGGGTYYYRVRAYNGSGTSADSNVVTVLTVPPAPVATDPLGIGETAFQAHWNAAAGATGYRLDISTSNDFAVFIPGYHDLDVGNVTHRDVSGLSGGTTYYYRLRAYNASGTSADSNVITVLTLPSAPVTLAATGITATGFLANWNAVNGALSYRLDVSTASDFSSYVPGYQNLNVLNVTSHAVTGLSPSVVYYYRVRAYNNSGTSADSNVITVLTVPPAPVALAATATTSSAFQANWQAALAATGYRLDVSTVNTFATCVAGYQDLDVGNALSHGVSGLAPGTTYYYRVRATNGSGSSADSNVIQLTTLAVHTLRFLSTAGGSLAGQLTQTVDHGGDCTPVRADPAVGSRFVEWSGVGVSFHSIANPLTVRNVQEDMTLRATFTNAAPLVRIVAPDDGAMVWGPVAIRAEVSDDLAVSSVEFYVDGAEPAGGNDAAPVASSEASLIDSGDLLADFRGADALLLDGQLRLRKTSFQGGWQPVIVGDFALRDVALAGTRKVHLIFAEPLRLADGVFYSWVCCDLETGKAAGITGTPVSLPQAPGGPLVQFDAAGNGYYFAADAAGVPALWQQPAAGGDSRARELTRGLRMLSGQQVRQWLALPDGGVLLELWRPETARLSRVRILPGGGDAVRVEGDFESALGMAAAPVAAATRFKVQGEKLLAASSAALAVADWASMSWRRYSSSGIRVADMALSSDGGLFFIGSDPGDGLNTLCSAGSGGCRRLVPLPQACLRLAVLGAAPGEQADEEACGGPVMGSGSVFSQDWNTLAYANGEHRLSVVARDAAGSAARDDITVTVANVGLALSAERFSDHAWLIRKEYARVRLSAENACGAPVAKYVIYRRRGGGTAETAGEFLPSELRSGSCELIEPYAGGVTYWALALSADGAVIGASAEITI